MRFWHFKSALFLLLLLWNLGIFSEFLISRISGLNSLLPFLSIGYSNVCHQSAWKTIGSGAFHTLVCSRCSGIYAGALVLSLLAVFMRGRFFLTNTRLLALMMLPLLADVIFYNSGLYNYSKTAAFLTGFLSGSGVFLYILGAFFTMFNKSENKG
ncbi:MAG: DUF2085 domain-containing protein [Syntrophothermus sp.]